MAPPSDHIFLKEKKNKSKNNEFPEFGEWMSKISPLIPIIIVIILFFVIMRFKFSPFIAFPAMGPVLILFALVYFFKRYDFYKMKELDDMKKAFCVYKNESFEQAVARSAEKAKYWDKSSIARIMSTLYFNPVKGPYR